MNQQQANPTQRKVTKPHHNLVIKMCFAHRIIPSCLHSSLDYRLLVPLHRLAIPLPKKQLAQEYHAGPIGRGYIHLGKREVDELCPGCLKGHVMLVGSEMEVERRLRVGYERWLEMGLGCWACELNSNSKDD